VVTIQPAVIGVAPFVGFSNLNHCQLRLIGVWG
jgi:hypothetical protein